MSGALDIDAIAARLDAAQQHAEAIPQLDAGLTTSDAYRVQAALLARRFARGERAIGLKMGFTSEAKRVQMGVADVICGYLTDAMVLPDGGVIQHARFVHPRVEPEIAFRLRKRLSGAVSEAEALDAIDGVAPAMEIIDSRFKSFKFSLTDVIADNASSAAFVVGAWRAPDVDLANLRMVLRFDGTIEAAGSSAEILGHPLQSLMAAARLAEEAGASLEAGWIVMAGAATEAVALRPGLSVTHACDALGQVSFRVEA